MVCLRFVDGIPGVTGLQNAFWRNERSAVQSVGDEKCSFISFVGKEFHVISYFYTLRALTIMALGSVDSKFSEAFIETCDCVSNPSTPSLCLYNTENIIMDFFFISSTKSSIEQK